ncbi:MAG TPA: site-2 protease family protein, partial [Pontibacter sp.]
MDIVIMVAQLILGLTILVGLHELGHMLTAKWFGMRVEKYAIGFPPKVFSKKIGETEYMLGLIPLGGFVKISGMVDESMDTETLKEEPKPWEFRAKPAWQRLIVMMGGIIVNVITGIVIYIFLTYNYGENYLP